MNDRVNDSRRFDSIIEKYHNVYTELSHTELADEIIEGEERMKRPLDISHRTLRLRVSEYRDLLEKRDTSSSIPDKLKEYPKTPNECFNPSGFKGEDMYYVVGGEPIDPAQLSFDFMNDLVVGRLDTKSNNVLEGIDPWNVPLPSTNKLGKKVWVVAGCIHLPFNHKPFFKAFISFIKWLKDNDRLAGVLLAGDIVDNHSISRHAKGKITLPGYDLSKEYREANQLLDKIDDAAGNVEKIYFYGNHEEWYYDYMSNVDNTKLGNEVIKSPEEALRLKSRGYKVYNKYKKAKHMLGDLLVIHGEFVNKHTAHEHLQRMKRNVMFVHTHRMGSYVEGELTSYNIGWMGDKDQPVFSYMSDIQKENWALGFATVLVDNSGKSHVTQLMWKNNSFYYDGIKFE